MPVLDHRMVEKFEQLSARLEELMVLLEDAEERLWLRFMQQGARQVRQKRLAGATYVLGCYGGEDTFSDLVIHKSLLSRDPKRHKLLNRRLAHLRNSIFTVADEIAAASAQIQPDNRKTPE